MARQRTLVLLLATIALLGAVGASTYANICQWGPHAPKTMADFDGSYCHNAIFIAYHEVENCPCSVNGSVSATGPFACSFHAIIRWGGPGAMSQITLDAPTALVATYDLDLECGQTFKVDMHCSCGERAPLSYFTDQGECMQACEDEEPPPPPG